MSNSARNTALTISRKQISTPGFDPSSYLSNQVANIALDGNEPEQKLLQLFNDLFKHLDGMSQEIEEEVIGLQHSAGDMQGVLFNELDDQLDKLSDVGRSVDEVKQSFDNASEGAVKVGGRLAISDRERQNIDKSIELLSYVRFFEEADEAAFSNILSMNSQRLREMLPEKLQSQDWAMISEVLHDLKKILVDINAEDVQKAQKIVLNVADVVEMELLGQFDAAVHELMESADNQDAIDKARALAECLHLFNSGQALQKRYIFSVVQRRIPNDAFFRNDKDSRSLLTKVKQAITGQHRDDDASSDGASDSGSTVEFSTNHLHTKGEDMSLQLIDHLSGLFTMINKVCIEQFSLIRRIFPFYTIARVTRLLVQRIFSDPAFGIQARVDAILCPQPPSPSLPPADYLDALLTVREKLTALYLLLLECSSDPAMRGMGSESESLRKAKRDPVVKARANSDAPAYATRNRQDSRLTQNTEMGAGVGEEEDIEDRLRSDIEIREFFDEQISQVLAGYVNEYFDKELLHVRSQYLSALRKAVEDTPALGRVAAGSLLQLPCLKAEKLKSISYIVKSVANKQFLNSVYSITTDAIGRMESIGRDDRKLSVVCKDLFLMQLGMVVDGILLPYAKACVNMLLKICSVNKGSQSNLPPMELLSAIQALLYGHNKMKSHFEENFMRPLLSNPNLVVVCKEARRKSVRSVLQVAKEAMHAWTLAITFHIEKLLATLQSKYDYAPTSTSSSSNGAANGSMVNGAGVCTSACDTICKVIMQVTNTIRQYEAQLQGMDLNAMFWKPFGQQCIGALIVHIKRQKVTREGCKMLMRDMQEYKHVMALMASVEVVDMMSCLEEICSIFYAEPHDVVKIVLEEFRHLDSSIVLSLLKARADFTSRGGADHWTKLLSSKFMNYKWESPLAWENRKPFTVISFAESMQSAQGSKLFGPVSLRKAAGSASALYMNEVLRPNTMSRNSLAFNERSSQSSITSSAKRQYSTSGAIALDINILESEDVDYHIRAAETNDLISRQTEKLQAPRLASKFLPARPDDPIGPSDSSRSSLTSAPHTPTTVARPDLIMGSRSSTARSNGHANGSSNGAEALRSQSTDAAPAKVNPIVAARKSSANGSANANANANGTTQAAAPPPLVHSPSKSRNMLNKVSSFFVGK